MLRIDLKIKLYLEGPFITKSTAPGAYGLDEVVARNSEGIIYMAGSHLVGKLRQAWEELEDALGGKTDGLAVPSKEEILMLLGNGVAQDGDMVPQRKRLYFSDIMLKNPNPGRGTRYRIQIDKDRGSAKQGAQLMLESPFAAGEEVVFVGSLTFLAKDINEAEEIRKYVLCGLQWVPQFGALRSIGFGRLVNVTVGSIRTTRPSARTRTWKTLDGFDLQIKPDAPFCIAGRPTAGNIFESSEDIPGNVILGCLARNLNQFNAQDKAVIEEKEDFFSALRKHFNKIRITHAFPAAECLQRPIRPPLSLVEAAGGLYDTALLEGPCLIKGEPPAFSIDWKDTTPVHQRYGWPGLRRELRVRTAIDPGSLRSKQGELFAYDMIVPDGRCWHVRVNVSRVEKDYRQEVMDQLAMLLEMGLFGFGKMKTTARVAVLDMGTVKDAQSCHPLVPGLGIDGLLAVTLQTPSLLCSPQGLKESSGAAELRRAYEEAWQDLCPQMKLLRYFARQTLAGGLYQHGRFRKDKEKNRTYEPWLLTEAGSVFVFAVEDPVAVQDKVTHWLQSGLELPASICKCYGLEEAGEQLWKYCPYIPQNGYGEIVVNLKDHEKLCPKPEEFTIIQVLAHAEKDKYDD